MIVVEVEEMLELDEPTDVVDAGSAVVVDSTVVEVELDVDVVVGSPLEQAVAANNSTNDSDTSTRARAPGFSRLLIIAGSASCMGRRSWHGGSHFVVTTTIDRIHRLHSQRGV